MFFFTALSSVHQWAAVRRLVNYQFDKLADEFIQVVLITECGKTYFFN